MVSRVCSWSSFAICMKFLWSNKTTKSMFF
jgi:hypothetical protein